MSDSKSTQPGNEKAAKSAGLVYVNDSDPGYTRRKKGDGFAYFDPGGKQVRDEDEIERLNALAVPPAYTDVWICMDPNGHLQATGRDDRGRKQYRYHPDWAKVRDAHKFERVVEFGAALPKLRRRLKRDLKRKGWPREKVLAIVISVMADTLVRVGNDAYARRNKSFGITTLRNRHVEFLRGGRATFRFSGKSGKQQEVEVDDTRLVKLIKGVQDLPGQDLFQYIDDDGETHAIGSSDVNEYLQEAMGEDFTAKDFRTWGGTLAAVEAFANTEVPEDAGKRELASIEKEIVTEIAELLGNTPAVCRKAYIDPSVFEAWEEGTLQEACGHAKSEAELEKAALKFLRAARRRAKRKLRAARNDKEKRSSRRPRGKSGSGASTSTSTWTS